MDNLNENEIYEIIVKCTKCSEKSNMRLPFREIKTEHFCPFCFGQTEVVSQKPVRQILME